MGLMHFLRSGIIRRMLNVGDPAPDFSIADHTGVTRRLSDYHGRNLILWFYPRADTPG